ncbi:MAG: ECF transporter S component [Clostridia bacterium]|nr:ECF transporter S component [Clostridia bacterium]
MPNKRKTSITVLAVLAGLILIATVAFCIVASSKGVSGVNIIKIALIMVICAVVCGIAISGIATYRPHEQYFSTQRITKLAVFSALSYLLYMFVKFPLPMLFPAFLDIQISDVPALLAGFMMGPVSGAIVVAIKIALKLPFSTTGMVGELGDLIMGIAFVVPAAIIYHRFHNKKGAILSLAIGEICCIIVAIIVNRFVLIPFYALIFDGGMQAVAGMMKSLYQNITAQNLYDYYLWLAVLPFNLLRCTLCALITFFMYKALSRMFDKIIPQKKSKVAQDDNSQDCASEN